MEGSFCFGMLYFGGKILLLAAILCLETSAKACTVAIAQDGVSVVQRSADGEWKHSRMVTLLIHEALEQAQCTLKDLEAVAVSQGPGSYTGLRVGASCAKGLCYGSHLRLLAIPTLTIIAQAQLHLGTEHIVPMIDARRMEVYYNIYDRALQPMQETNNLILDTDSFHRIKDKQVVFCGDGAFKLREFDLSEGWQIVDEGALAQHMAPLAEARFQQQIFEDVAYYVPFYLKPPNITKSKKPLF